MGGTCGRQSLQNGFANTIDVAQHIAIPEPEHTITVRVQIFGPQVVSRGVVRIIVLTAVDFDDQSLLMTGKVSEERPDGSLSSKMRACEGKAAQEAPQFAFRVGHVAA